MAEPNTNVIKFPKEHKNFASLANLEELKGQAIANKIEFVTFVADETIEEMYYKLGMIGFHFDDDELMKDSVLVLESLKSLMLKSMGIAHGLQEAAQNIIEIRD